MCTRVRAHVCECVHVWWRPGVDVGCFPLSLSSWVLGTGSLIELMELLTVLASSPPSLRLWGYRCHAFYPGAGDPNSRPYACLARALTTDPHPQPSQCILSFLILAQLWDSGIKGMKRNRPKDTQAGELTAPLKFRVFSWTGRRCIASCWTKGRGYYTHINTQPGLSMAFLAMWFKLWAQSCLSDIICFTWVSNSYHLPRFITSTQLCSCNNGSSTRLWFPSNYEVIHFSTGEFRNIVQLLYRHLFFFFFYHEHKSFCISIQAERVMGKLISVHPALRVQFIIHDNDLGGWLPYSVVTHTHPLSAYPAPNWKLKQKRTLQAFAISSFMSRSGNWEGLLRLFLKGAEHVPTEQISPDSDFDDNLWCFSGPREGSQGHTRI